MMTKNITLVMAGRRPGHPPQPIRDSAYLQLPALQLCPAEQAIPQPPQLLESVEVFVQPVPVQQRNEVPASRLQK